MGESKQALGEQYSYMGRVKEPENEPGEALGRS
jgi:hypothetical protein